MTSSINWPSSEGTNHKIGIPMATPTSVPMTLSASRAAWRYS